MANRHKIEAVDVYLEKRKAREYVGRLSYENSSFIFIYDDTYMYKNRSIPIGPDLPLVRKKFISESLFPSFEDRIPSRKNPAYHEYCNMVGIEYNEKDPLVLVATLGQKGPSSFIFSPVITTSITNDDVINFRKNLNLSIREFSDIFDFSPSTINRIEKKLTSGKDALKRLEIYFYFPEVALYEVNKNRFKINDEKCKYVEDFLQQFKNNRIK